MEIKTSNCEICKKKARDEKQKRAENWIRLNGGSCQGISVWLEKPRGKTKSFMHSVGWQVREYDFCSIECLVKALKAKESI